MTNDTHEAPAPNSQLRGVVDARPAPIDGGLHPCRASLLGVPLAFWAVRALRLVLPTDRIGVVTSNSGDASLFERFGLRVVSNDRDANAVLSAPSDRSANERVLVAQPSAPFCSPATARSAVEEGLAELTLSQTDAVERLRVRDADDLVEAEAVARGLAPSHPAVVGARAFLSPDLARIRAVVCDVDGTLTDGRVFFDGGHRTDHSGAVIDEPARAFDTHDGLALRMLMDAGVEVAVLSSTLRGESSRQRMRMLGVRHVDVAPGHKAQRFLDLCERMRVHPEHTLYVGDDVNDSPAMELAGVVACPSDAHPEIRASADILLEQPGGRGAVRHVADILLAARALASPSPAT